MYEECPSSRTSRCTLCLLFQLVAGVVCSNALLLRSRPVRQSLTCESEAAGYLVGEVQTTKGEAGDNRIGDQVRTVSVINDTQRSKREKMAERERDMEMEMDGFLRLDMGLGATKGDPGKVGVAVWRNDFESVKGALLPRLSLLHATNCRFREAGKCESKSTSKALCPSQLRPRYPDRSRCMRIHAQTA